MPMGRRIRPRNGAGEKRSEEARSSAGRRHCAGRAGSRQRATAQQKAAEGFAQRGTVDTGGGRSGHDHVGAGRQDAAQVAEVVTQDALDAIAADRMRVDLARHRQPQARGTGVGHPMQTEQRMRRTASAIEDFGEFAARPNAGAARKRGGRGIDHSAAFTKDSITLLRGAPRLARYAAPGSGAEALAALGATAGQHLAAVGRGHACTEAVVALALEVAGLVGALGGHDGLVRSADGKNRAF